MLSTAELTKKPNLQQPHQTEAVYLTADETLVQFVIDYYYRKYSQYFSHSGQDKELGVGYEYSIPSSPKLNLAPLPPQLQAQSERSNVLCTVDTLQLGLTFPDRKVSYTARVDILATCFLAGPRLMMKVDKAVATQDGQVDPVASKILEKIVVPVLVKWLEGILLPELTQVLGDQFKAVATSATVAGDQINSYARLIYKDEGTRPGKALPPVDMTPVAGAGSVRAVLREDALNIAAAALTPEDPFKAEAKAKYSIFSGEVEAKLWIKDPSINITAGRVICKVRLKASAKVSGKVGIVEESIKLSDECEVQAPFQVKALKGGEKVAISLALDGIKPDLKLKGDWGPLDFARKELNKTVIEQVEDALEKAMKYLSSLNIVVFDLTRLAKSAGLDVDVTAYEVGFGDETLYGQFTIRERS
jgi:hypothetical protein